MKISDVAVKTEIDGEFVVMNIDTGTFFALKDTAAAIWKRIEGGVPQKALVEDLSKDYNLDSNVAERHVGEFIIQLRDAGLIDL